jgi:hypothetical protein
MLAVCAAVFAASSSATPPKHTCKPAGSKTIANDGQARIYSVPFPRERPLASSSAPGFLYGCMFATRHPVPLGATEQISNRPGKPTSGAIDPKRVSLQAPWVAYSSSYSIEYANQLWVILRDLQTGQVKSMHTAAPELAVTFKINMVTDLAVGPDGSFAWISLARQRGGRKPGGPGLEAREVGAVDSSGNYTELDTSDNVDLHSLTLGEQQLSWSDGGVAHSAPLP